MIEATVGQVLTREASLLDGMDTADRQILADLLDRLVREQLNIPVDRKGICHRARHALYAAVEEASAAKSEAAS